MDTFIKKNSYAILRTLFDDDPYWIENVPVDDFWNEFKKTLETLPKINRFLFKLSIILFSIIPPPYSYFSLLYREELAKRKKWLNSWEHSKSLWRKSLFLGIRILILGSAFQLPQTSIHTNYTKFLSEREKQSCLRVNNQI